MFGDLTKQQEFAKRHKLLIDNVGNLKSLADTALSGCDKSTFEAMTLYTLARVAMEDDFWSIILLCANGFSHSAKQILRGMFERVVTLAYLAKHHDEIPLFNNFFRVDQRKRLRFYERNEPGKFSTEFIEEVERDYEEVKNDYLITDCKKCKTKRVNHMWSKMSLVAMAEEVGFSFKTIDAAYYMGLEEAHPKIDALFSRTTEEVDGSVTYEECPDIERGDDIIMTAAILQLKIFEVLQAHFEIKTMSEPLGPYLSNPQKVL